MPYHLPKTKNYKKNRFRSSSSSSPPSSSLTTSEEHKNNNLIEWRRLRLPKANLKAWCNSLNVIPSSLLSVLVVHRLHVNVECGRIDFVISSGAIDMVHSASARRIDFHNLWVTRCACVRHIQRSDIHNPNVLCNLLDWTTCNCFESFELDYANANLCTASSDQHWRVALKWDNYVSASDKKLLEITRAVRFNVTYVHVWD